MAISWFGEVFGLGTAGMAKSKKTRSDQRRVSAFVDRLVSAKSDKAAFEIAVGDLESAEDLMSVDVIAVAHLYNKGGKKPTSRAAALTMIRKRFVEIVRTANKNKVAHGARPW